MASAPARPCAQPGCPALIRGKTSRCPAHQLPTRKTSERGLGWSYQKARAEVIKAQPWCSICMHPGSRKNPLTADHVLHRSQGGDSDLSNLRTVCRSCNSRRGAR